MKGLNKNENVAVFVSIAVIAFFFAAASILGFFSGGGLIGGGSAAVSESVDSGSKSDSGLVVADIVVGTGEEAVSGKVITVHYTGTLQNGTKFDSSLDRGTPFRFVLGAGQVIEGWERGIAGMKVGGQRKLTISPELAYGDNAVGPIPANSTLVFDVELLGVENQ